MSHVAFEYSELCCTSHSLVWVWHQTLHNRFILLRLTSFHIKSRHKNKNFKISNTHKFYNTKNKLKTSFQKIFFLLLSKSWHYLVNIRMPIYSAFQYAHNFHCFVCTLWIFHIYIYIYICIYIYIYISFSPCENLVSIILYCNICIPMYVYLPF